MTITHEYSILKRLVKTLMLKMDNINNQCTIIIRFPYTNKNSVNNIIQLI